MGSALARPQDRRLDHRHCTIAAHRILAARVRPGHYALIINVSASGALLDTTFRMLPGGLVDVQLERADYRAAIRGRVVRCAVERLEAGRVLYRGAMRFETRLLWLVEEQLGYSIPTRERHLRGEFGDTLPLGLGRDTAR